MDEQLAERKLPIESLRLSSSSSSASSPSQPPTPTPLTPPPPLASSTPKNRRVPTGVGKGSPGKPRKVNVSKRAERNRMKRKPELQCATHNSPSKRKGPETSRAGSSSPPPPIACTRNYPRNVETSTTCTRATRHTDAKRNCRKKTRETIPADLWRCTRRGTVQ